MVRITQVSVRVFYEEGSKPIAYITFSARDQARSVKWSLEDAANLGKMLLIKKYHFLPWTGIVFGWQAYRDEGMAQERRCQSEDYARMQAII